MRPPVCDLLWRGWLPKLRGPGRCISPSIRCSSVPRACEKKEIDEPGQRSLAEERGRNVVYCMCMRGFHGGNEWRSGRRERQYYQVSPGPRPMLELLFLWYFGSSPSISKSMKSYTRAEKSQPLSRVRACVSVAHSQRHTSLARRLKAHMLSHWPTSKQSYR